MIIVYTDGACSPNPGMGAWAWVEARQNKLIGLSGSGFDPKTTNNRMEYLAAIEALEEFKNRGEGIIIFSDSMLLVNTANLWMWRWEKRGWPETKKNLDLVKRLFGLVSGVRVQFKWVKGHAGDFFNEYADRLAGETMKNGILNMRYGRLEKTSELEKSELAK